MQYKKNMFKALGFTLLIIPTFAMGAMGFGQGFGASSSFESAPGMSGRGGSFSVPPSSNFTPPPCAATGTCTAADFTPPASTTPPAGVTIPAGATAPTGFTPPAGTTIPDFTIPPCVAARTCTAADFPTAP